MEKNKNRGQLNMDGKLESGLVGTKMGKKSMRERAKN